jgi:hypothetical protein
MTRKQLAAIAFLAGGFLLAFVLLVGCYLIAGLVLMGLAGLLALPGTFFLLMVMGLVGFGLVALSVKLVPETADAGKH